jgi:hypothetical protein
MGPELCNETRTFVSEAPADGAPRLTRPESWECLALECQSMVEMSVAIYSLRKGWKVEAADWQ